MSSAGPIVDLEADRWRCSRGHSRIQRQPGSRRIVECESCRELAGEHATEIVVMQHRHLFDAESEELVAVSQVRWADRE